MGKTAEGKSLTLSETISNMERQVDLFPGFFMCDRFLCQVMKMKRAGINGSYNKLYSSLGFERAGLFELIKDKYGCGTVLYPGCSIHITPSFFFQHVVYVDISETAKGFFQDNQNVLSIINDHKKYKQSAFIQFIHSDYTKKLPVRENNYDLLLSIYAGGIIESCKKYVKPAGIIISNNHHNDAQQALKDPSVRLEALIRRKGKKYHMENGADEKAIMAMKEQGMTSKNLKNTSSGTRFVDNQCYFVFRKT